MRTKRFVRCPPRAIVLAAVVLFVPSVVVSQGISPEQVVSIEQVSSVAMRPDGGHVAYTLSKPRGSDDRPGDNYSELWLVAEGSNLPQRIIAGPQSAFGPTWSPDGSMLAFRANLDQHENTQVYAVTVEDHTPRLLIALAHRRVVVSVRARRPVDRVHDARCDVRGRADTTRTGARPMGGRRGLAPHAALDRGSGDR